MSGKHEQDTKPTDAGTTSEEETPAPAGEGPHDGGKPPVEPDPLGGI